MIFGVSKIELAYSQFLNRGIEEATKKIGSECQETQGKS